MRDIVQTSVRSLIRGFIDRKRRVFGQDRPQRFDRSTGFAQHVLLLEDRLMFSAVPVGDLTEGNASAWTTFASDQAATAVSDDTTHVREGTQSLHFVTASGFDTGVRLAAPTGGWDLTTVNLLDFWVYGDNQNPLAWQGNQPIIVLTSALGKVTYTPRQLLMPNGEWARVRVPMAGDSSWNVAAVGSFDMTQVTGMEIHQDTWDYGFQAYYDGMEFVNRDLTGLPPAGPPPPAGVNSDAISPKVLLYIFDPIMENFGGLRQHEAYGWQDPQSLAAQVVSTFATDSHGLVQYQLETQVVDEHPYFEDGFQHTDESFAAAWEAQDFHQSSHFDYVRFAQENNIAARIDDGELDEVWIYTGPISGTYESAMGGAGAYFINGPVQPIPSQRAFPIMGLNFERGVGEAIHSFGHRLENTMNHVYAPQGNHLNNNWDKFTFQDRYQSGLGGLGNVHFPVNGTQDYDYSNTTLVLSNADDWYNYPNFQGVTRLVNVDEWADPVLGDQYGYLSWWYNHLPHYTGRGTDFRLNNWWRYFVDLNQFKSMSGDLSSTEGQPFVQVTLPTSTTGMVDLVPDVFDDGALGRVDFYVDGVFQQSDALGPFTFEWNTDTAGTGDHVIQFRAYDLQNGTEGTSTPAIVNVLARDIPTDIALAPSMIAENNAANATVGTLSATGPGTGNTFTFSLVPGTGSIDNGSFSIVGNELHVTAVADHETKSSYSIRVQAVSQSGLVLQKQMTINVTNVNEAPTDIALSSTIILENNLAHAVVGTLAGVDPDAGNAFTFDLVQGTGSIDNGSFSISGNQLMVTPVTSTSNQSTYQIRLQVTDQNGLKFEKPFIIRVIAATDVDALLKLPFDGTLTGSTGQVPKSSAGDTFTTGLNGQAVHVGATGYLNYPLAGNILPSQGSIEFSIRPDWNGNTNMPFYLFQAGNDATGGMVLVVDGANNLQFIQWGDDPNTPAVERNVGRGLGYSVNNWVAGEWHHLAVTWDGAAHRMALYVDSQFATENDDDITINTFFRTYLTIGANENGQSPAQATFDNFRISNRVRTTTEIQADAGLTGENLHDPVLNDISVNLAENSLNGKSVTTLQATDADVISNFAYTIVDGNSQGIFSIDQTTGVISVANNVPLNYELQSSFVLTVQVSDGGPAPARTSTGLVTINLTNVNEAPTGLALSTNQIAENNAANAIVGVLSGTDPDNESDLSFSLVSGIGDTDNGSFSVSGNSLTIIPSTNYEVQHTYFLRIRVTDQGGLTFDQLLVVNISDINEHPALSSITDQTTLEDFATGSLQFSISDPETSAANLIVTGSSSNPTLVSNANITFGGTGADRNVTITPLPNQSGSVTITVTVNDGASSSNRTFQVTVQPVDDPAVITLSLQPLEYHISAKKVVAIDGSATISDIDTPTMQFTGSTLTVSGQAAKDTLSVIKQDGIGLKGMNILFGGQVIGTLAGGKKGTPVAIQLNASATQNSVQKLLRAIGFKSTDKIGG
ncbi:MAG: tandem-95 repeat protein, partial [Planctomycetaceae bacterium]|nr:tandem-95 repeat protein [Planctomycetaceae bacterium]